MGGLATLGATCGFTGNVSQKKNVLPCDRRMNKRRVGGENSLKIQLRERDKMLSGQAGEKEV